jgi:hypothetical protein
MSLDTIIPVIQEDIGECRRMHQDLQSLILDDLGLLATFSWFCRRFETIYSHVGTEQTIQKRLTRIFCRFIIRVGFGRRMFPYYIPYIGRSGSGEKGEIEKAGS